MTDFTPLVTGEVEIDSSDELLYRQVTSTYWDEINHIPGTPAFGPANADKGQASFSRSTKVSAQASRDWHSANAAKPSKGVWACTASEVVDAKTRAVDDSGLPSDPKRSPGHCYVDYRHLDKAEERILRAELLALAIGRGEIATSESPAPE